MVLSGKSEFVGREARTSKNGNNYMVIRFDDILTGEQYSFYWDSKLSSAVDPLSLERHHVYDLEFNYRYNSFDRRYQVDLVNIVGVSDE